MMAEVAFKSTELQRIKNLMENALTLKKYYSTEDLSEFERIVELEIGEHLMYEYESDDGADSDVIENWKKVNTTEM